MPQETKLSSVKFHYVKSNFFRVIHVDGAYGGLTPYGFISCALYSDRQPLPELTENAVREDGIVGQEIVEHKKIKDGIEREIEVSIVMNLNTAKALQQWLDDKIKTLESMQPLLMERPTQEKLSLTEVKS